MFPSGLPQQLVQFFLSSSHAPSVPIFKSHILVINTGFYLFRDVRLVVGVVKYTLFGNNNVNTKVYIVCYSLCCFVQIQLMKDTPVCTKKTALQCLHTILRPLQHSFLDRFAGLKNRFICGHEVYS